MAADGTSKMFEGVLRCFLNGIELFRMVLNGSGSAQIWGFLFFLGEAGEAQLETFFLSASVIVFDPSHLFELFLSIFVGHYMHI